VTKHVVLSLIKAKWHLEHAISQISDFFNWFCFTFYDFFLVGGSIKYELIAIFWQKFPNKNLKNTLHFK
jgi:hypothetical protein